MSKQIRPSTQQFWAENIITVIISLVIIFIATNIYIAHPLIISALFFALLLYLFYRWLYLRSFIWRITPDVITEKRGLMKITTDHIELYRIIDYQETQTFLQRLFGVKTVVIVSTDKLNGILIMKGIPKNIDVVTIIRNRVEICKQQKRIYEITNN